MSKTVIITGTSRGLGYSLAECFLKNAWKVYCVVRTKNDADRIKNINLDFCFPIVSDITSDTIQSDIEATFSKSEKIDVLINNAGVGGSGELISNTSVAGTEKLLNVHCLGPMRVTKAVLPFLKHDGIIINISSRFGSTTKVASGELDVISCSYSYRIAKAAQNMFSLCLSREFKDSALKICAIHPGKLKTDSGSVDADKKAAEAAERLYLLLDTIENGKFYSLFENEINW